jgi:hypothetical protein
MQRLVHALDAVKDTRSRKAKVKHLSTLLKTLSREELPFTARLILGRLLPLSDTRTLGVGWALLSAAAADASGHTIATSASRAARSETSVTRYRSCCPAAHGTSRCSPFHRSSSASPRRPIAT